jgi:NAD dependent epimerase/dehydratase family enzyme
MADALLLSSQRVEPRQLMDSGFTFRFADFETAVRHVLGRT